MSEFFDDIMQGLVEATEIRKVNTEVPPLLLSNLISWMRNKEISDEDIVDCILYICKDKNEE